MLTAREVDIIARLMDGYRVPAIARELYLSQSTIRNHLSSAFQKLGVHSQQQLIDLVRESTERLRSQDISSS
jgi:DNA-binding NarL/FixJ family response regulator